MHTITASAYRTHAAGLLRPTHIGQTVQLAGWVKALRQYKKFAFLELREASGCVQLIVAPELLQGVTVESTITVTGTVQARHAVHPQLAQYPTGEVEVAVTTLTVLGAAQPLPFHEHETPGEEEMLAHRPLAMRWPRYQQPLVQRAHIVRAMRTVVEELGFMEVETPVLVRQTPGGAAPFVVPVTEHTGYALAQSPQIWKQLLICGGIERYYQLAHCFRNEGARPDRQPEFSQFEIEAAFTSAHEVQAVMEACVQAAAEAVGVALPEVFPRMSYEQAINTFGSDKPHLGNPLRLHTVPQTRGVTVTLVLPEASGSAVLEPMVACWLSAVPPALKATWSAATHTLTVEGPSGSTQAWCGRALTEAGAVLGLMAPGHYPLWVEAFPLMERGEHGWEAVHHPFTRPAQGQEGVPLHRAQSEAFDLVLNGSEVGGGSMRIHEPELQRKVLALLGLPLEHFAPLIQSLAYGAPPHGGMALGVERLVALLVGASSIREVMAFPKTTGGQCLLTHALSER